MSSSLIGMCDNGSFKFSIGVEMFLLVRIEMYIACSRQSRLYIDLCNLLMQIIKFALVCTYHYSDNNLAILSGGNLRKFMSLGNSNTTYCFMIFPGWLCTLVAQHNWLSRQFFSKIYNILFWPTLCVNSRDQGWLAWFRFPLCGTWCL